ncbi:MAG: hypothetical protein AB9891_12415 [Anaerolineaceae bacterium]
MKYICMEDIENLVAQGKKELVVDENMVLMDLARDMARQLGIAIVDGSHPAPAQVTPSSTPSAPARTASAAAPAPSPRDSASELGAKPKGCQHGPLPVVAVRQEQPKIHQSSDGVVDQLVELVRQSTGKRSGN